MTLIETTVYLALFGVAFLLIVEFGLRMSEYQRLSLNRTEIQKAVIVINQEFLSSIDTANSIDATSEFDTNKGNLILNTDSGNVTFGVSNNKLIKTDSTEQINLTSDDQIVSNFIFSEILSDEGEIAGVSIDLTIQYAKNTNVSESLSTIYAL